MTQRSRTEFSFVKLSDSDFMLESPEQDIRGNDVYDVGGKQIGSVDDLYIDGQKRKVCFLELGLGGFLGMGEKHFLVPVEAVTEVGEGRVTIEPGKEKVIGSLTFDANVVPPTTDHRPDAHDYYDDTDPYRIGAPRNRYPGGGVGRW